MDWYYALLEFYVSLVTYTILHMIFVISSDFVEAFNIPPLNIGIYVDKLAAIRALLMVIADIIEWYITQQTLHDGAHQQKALKELELEKGQGSRRIGSLLSFIAMLCCRCYYLWIVYKSDNKSLSVFITLCIEGFWFGTFQMGFFAIGPEYNAYTSLGIHTMGNFIFFLQLILQRRAKTKPKINCLYRVRVHGWICLVTSVIALCLWLYFCICVTAKGEDAPSEWPDSTDVWSPFLLFIVGAFAEDFAVPGILPFAFLDPEKANLVNYLTPVFFMSGAVMIVLWNDWVRNLGSDLGFKDWSSSKYTDKGHLWHTLWLLNIPKYIAFFISMWSIHGTFGDLRCIIQSRWRVMLLTMTVVVPRAKLEVAGYVGVANWAIGRADFGLVEAELIRTIAHGLKEGSVTSFPVTNANTLKTAIENQDNKVKEALAGWINFKYWTSISKESITVIEDASSAKKVKVVIGTSETPQGTSEADVTQDNESKGVKVTITVNEDVKKYLGSKATEIANRIAGFVAVAALTSQISSTINSKDKLKVSDIQGALNKAKEPYLKNLVKGYNGADVYDANNTGISVTDSDNKVTVEFKMSEKFNDLVGQLKSQVGSQLTGPPRDADDIATKLETVLSGVKDNKIKPLAQSMVGKAKHSNVENVSVSKSGAAVTLEIKPTGDGSGQKQKGESAKVTFEKNSHTATVEIKVVGPDTSGATELTPAEGTAIARLVALAMVNQTVKNAVRDYTITLKEQEKVGDESVTGNLVPVKGPSEDFHLQVKLHKSLAKDGVSAETIASDLAMMIKGSAVAAGRKHGRPDAFKDFNGFTMIALHDMLAMFCRFVYGKFAVGYNSI